MNATIKINDKEYERLGYLLTNGDQGVRKFNLEEEVDLFKDESPFENGYTGHLEVFTGQNDIMASFYLFDSDGNELGCEESDAAIEDHCIFEIEGVEYILEIEATPEKEESVYKETQVVSFSSIGEMVN